MNFMDSLREIDSLQSESKEAQDALGEFVGLEVKLATLSLLWSNRKRWYSSREEIEKNVYSLAQRALDNLLITELELRQKRVKELEK